MPPRPPKKQNQKEDAKKKEGWQEKPKASHAAWGALMWDVTGDSHSMSTQTINDRPPASKPCRRTLCGRVSKWGGGQRWKKQTKRSWGERGLDRSKHWRTCLGKRVSKQGGGKRWERQASDLRWAGLDRAKNWRTCLGKGWANQVVGRDRTRQTMANSASRVEWGDNRHQTDVYLPNGHIGPPRNLSRTGFPTQLKCKKVEIRPRKDVMNRCWGELSARLSWKKEGLRWLSFKREDKQQ